jgi:hypothetical protein
VTVHRVASQGVGERGDSMSHHKPREGAAKGEVSVSRRRKLRGEWKGNAPNWVLHRTQGSNTQSRSSSAGLLK